MLPIVGGGGSSSMLPWLSLTTKIQIHEPFSTAKFCFEKTIFIPLL